MASLQSRRVAVSVVGFLRNQITETNSATSTSFEDCLDGAIQFLTSAFGLDQSFITSVTLPGSLTEIFEAGCKQLTMEKSGERYGGLSFAKPRPVRAPVSEDDKANAEMLKDDGNQLMSEERFSEASEAYSRALELDPNNAVIYYNRAAAYYRLGEYCSVVRDCNSALHLNHKYAKAFSLKAIALFSLQRYREAYEYFAEASRLEPANETYTANLRQAYAKLSFEIGAAKASAVEHDFQTRGHSAARPLPLSLEGLNFMPLITSIMGDMAVKVISDTSLLKKITPLFLSFAAKMPESQILDLLEHGSTFMQNNPQLFDALIQGNLIEYGNIEGLTDFIDSLTALQLQRDSGTDTTEQERTMHDGAGRAENSRESATHGDTPGCTYRQRFKVDSYPDLAEQVCDFATSFMASQRRQDDCTDVTSEQRESAMHGTGRTDDNWQLAMHSDMPSSHHHQHCDVHNDSEADLTPNLTEQSEKHGIEGDPRVEVVEANVRPVTKSYGNRRKHV